MRNRKKFDQEVLGDTDSMITSEDIFGNDDCDALKEEFES